MHLRTSTLFPALRPRLRPLFPALRRAAAVAVMLLGSGLTAPALQAETLVMVEEVGCIYCARFNAQIAPAYPNTAEGQFAPLRRVEITDPLPEDLTFKAPAVFTPTFVLVDDDGQELGRIEGYPGEDFFWPLLGAMLSAETDFDPDAPIAPPETAPPETAPRDAAPADQASDDAASGDTAPDDTATNTPAGDTSSGDTAPPPAQTEGSMK